MKVEETSPINRWIGNYVNQVYVWNNNAPFYALATPYLVNFYQTQVRLWDLWNTGFVPNFHSEIRGVIPTNHANAICHKVADIINGDGVIFKSKDDKGNNEALDFLTQNFNNRVKLSYVFKDSILKSVQLGNSLLKINCDEDNQLWVEAISGNRFFVDLNSRGEIVRSRSYINIFTSGIRNAGHEQDSFGLVEERYWKELDEPEVLGDIVITRKPVARYAVYKLNGISNVFTAGDINTSIPYTSLPPKIQKQFKTDYGDIWLGEEMYLPLRDLGVYLIKHTHYVENMPNIKLGESVIARILNQLMKYDTIFSEEYNDLYLSRAKVIIPGFMQSGDKNKLGQGLSGFIFERIPSMSDREQMPTIFAPKMRSKDFIEMREDVKKEIASNIGVAASSLYSDLSEERGAVTATEINSENSNTELFRRNKREIPLPEFNKCVDTILAFYGYGDEVDVDFPSIGSSNKSQLVDDTIKLKQARIISTEQALRDIYHSDSERQIDNKLEDTLNSQEENVIRYIGKGDSPNESSAIDKGAEVKGLKPQLGNDTKA